MTSKERLLAAMRGRPIDRVANMPLIKQFCARQVGISFRDYNRDHRVLVECQLRMRERWDIDCFNVTGFAYREAGDCGLPLTWLADAPPHPDGVLVTERRDIAALRWPAPWDGPLMSDRLAAIRLFKERRPDIAVHGWVEGPFAQAATFHGLEQTMADLVLEPDLLRALMDYIVPHEAAFARAQLDAGAEIIGIGDAAASVIGPASYREVVLPYERELIRAIHAHGGLVKLHICGDITHLLPDIARTGADMVDIDWMVDLRRARAVLGTEVCLCGNFDPVAVLLQAGPDDVRDACRRCIVEAGTPFVLSAGCEVPPDTPADNFGAMCERYLPAL